MKDQPLGNANLQKSETSPKKNNKRLVGGKSCRSFSFTVGYWTSVIWKALAAEWHWEHRLCTDQCPMLALLVNFICSLINYGEILAEEREELLALKHKMQSKNIFLSIDVFLCNWSCSRLRIVHPQKEKDGISSNFLYFPLLRWTLIFMFLLLTSCTSLEGRQHVLLVLSSEAVETMVLC